MESSDSETNLRKEREKKDREKREKRHNDHIEILRDSLVDIELCETDTLLLLSL